MGVFEMVVAIVIVGCIAGCVMEGLKQFGKSRSRKGPEIKALEERIAALEGNGSLEERIRNLEKRRVGHRVRKRGGSARPRIRGLSPTPAFS